MAFISSENQDHYVVAKIIFQGVFKKYTNKSSKYSLTAMFFLSNLRLSCAIEPLDAFIRRTTSK